MDNLVELFCIVDDFCKILLPELEPRMLPNTHQKRGPMCRLTSAEIMTILIYFHQSHYRDFKAFYIHEIQTHWTQAFPDLVSYNRFVELMPSVVLLLCLFIHFQSKTLTGIYFMDSTTLAVCHYKRANFNRVFKGLAKKSKSTMGWYFGFKLHLVINDHGELLAFKLTQSTVDDRKPVSPLTLGLMGKLIGDKGYISQSLFDELYQRGLQLITRIKKNMKNKLMPMIDKILLRKRAVIESVIDQLKNISQIEHSRHRSPANFMVNLLAGLAAYTLQPKKPSLNFKQQIVCTN